MSFLSKSGRSLFRRSDGKLCLVILLLVLCVSVQAVGAKTAYYAGDSPQALHFSTSIKIANLVYHEVVPQPVAAIPVPHCSLQIPRVANVLHFVEFKPAEIAPPASTILSRSPPRIL